MSNSISPAVAESMQLPMPSIGDEALADLINDESRFAFMHYVVRRHKRGFQRIIKILEHRSSYSSVALLLDCDVIRRYMDMQPVSDLDAFAVEYLFTQTSVKYYIPQGAFEELQDYLTQRVRDHGIIAAASRESASSKEIQQAASHFGYDAGDLSREEHFDELRSKADRSLVEVGRLDTIFNDRYLGILGSRLETHQAAWADALRTRDRANKEKRDLLDERDSKNLTLLSEQLLDKSRLPDDDKLHSECRILVSATNLVLHLMDDYDDANHLALNQLLQHFGTDAYKIGNSYAVIQPRDVMLIALLDGFDDPHGALARAEDYESIFVDLEDAFKRQLHLKNISRTKSFQELFVPTIKANRQKLRAGFERLGTEFYNESAPFRKIEQSRATLESQNSARRKQLTFNLTPLEEIASKSVQFSVLLTRISARFNSADFDGYSVDYAGPTLKRPFHHFVIKRGARILLTGRYWSDAQLQWLSLHWEIVCLEENLCQGLKTSAAINPTSLADSTETSSMVWPDSVQSKGADGLHVVAGDKVFYIPFSEWHSKDWDLLDVSNLKARIAGDRPDFSDYVKAHPFEALRLITKNAIIHYDIQPGVGDSSRFLIYSARNFNITSIYQLFSNTSAEFILPERFTKTLAGALQQCGATNG